MKVRTISHALVAVALVVQLPTLLVATSSPDPGQEAVELATTPSKLCHPKKPITCRAGELAAAALLTEAQPVSKQAGLCIGPRWLCSAEENSVASSEALLLPVDPQPVSKQAGLCIGPRWLCSTSDVQ
ncbi:MAG TPA: hypothetical protein VNA04_18165 [Thermoanaerobaculia bacterium]|nr:hypothetical protein [Thermoanaerobaculia bacterium]